MLFFVVRRPRPSETTLLRRLHYPFIIELHESFQNSSQLFFILALDRLIFIFFGGEIYLRQWNSMQIGNKFH